MSVAYISHADCGRHDTGWSHPEHVGRLRAVARAIRNDYELFQNVHHLESRHATVDELALAHDERYIERVRAFIAAGGGQLDPDSVASEGSWDAATAATGAVLDGVDMAFDGRATRTFAAVRPPGHHALRSRSMGFCMFGSVAIAAHYARAKHGVQRVLIVDWDVHHGNGTQALVESEPDVHFVSMHQWPWYPGTGAADDRGKHGTVWNVPLPPGLERANYVESFLRAVDESTKNWQPELILISAGFDSLAGDPLGGFTLEIEDVNTLTLEMVARAKSWCDGRLVSALEGGYAPERLGEAAVAHLHALQ